MPMFVYIGTPLNPGSQVYTSGSGNFTVPTYYSSLRVRIWGGGGGGTGAGVYVNNDAVAGSNSSFNTSVIATGGSRATFVGTDYIGGASVSGSGGDFSSSSEAGGDGRPSGSGDGGDAANTAQGGGAGGTRLLPAPTAGVNGTAPGGGGSGANSNGTNYGAGGAGGGFTEKVYAYTDLTLGASIPYVVGSGGAGGTASVVDGGAGATGRIEIDWDY